MKNHYDGTIIYLKKNREIINIILDKSNYDNKKSLQYVLSYPYYDIDPSYKNYENTINIFIKDKSGEHCILTDYPNDDGSYFINKITPWINYILNNYDCSVEIEI